MLLDAKGTLKIADFGVARVQAKNPEEMTGMTGTPGYMAPEVLLAANQSLQDFRTQFLHFLKTIFFVFTGYSRQAIQQKV